MFWFLRFSCSIVIQIWMVVTIEIVSGFAADWKDNVSSADTNRFPGRVLAGNIVYIENFSKSAEFTTQAQGGKKLFQTSSISIIHGNNALLLVPPTHTLARDQEHEENIDSLIRNNTQHKADQKNDNTFEGSDVTTHSNSMELSSRDSSGLDHLARFRIQYCFASHSHKFPEDSNLPTCISTQMEVGVRKCDIPELSCRNRCQEELNNQSTSSRTSCYCHAHCLLYNSCCEDFEEQCPKNHEDAEEQLKFFEGKQAVCNKHKRAMLIAHCPRDTPDEQLRNQCENPDLSRIAYLFPVTDSVSGHHFQNIYCWKCWSMKGDALQWKAMISFNDRNIHDKVYDRKPVISFFAKIFWKTLWAPPQDGPAFFCESCAVSRCTGCSDAKYQKLCSSLNSPVEVNYKVYANIYCYVCSQEYLDSYNTEKRFRNMVDSQCEIATIPDPLRYNFNPRDRHAFEFFVVASVIEGTMRLEAQVSQYFTFEWSSLSCSDDASECNATKCTSAYQLESSRCVYREPTRAASIKIMLRIGENNYLPDLSFSPKLDLSKILLMDTLKLLCGEHLEEEFKSSDFTVKDWVTDVENLALYVQYESTKDLYLREQYKKFKNFIFVKAMEALNIHDVPGITYICVGGYKFEHSDPIQMRFSDCYPYVSHLGMDARYGACSLPANDIMWIMSALYVIICLL